MMGRGAGFSDMWTAPPPITAPPQVQAHNFAKAIFTDIRAPHPKLRGAGREEDPNIRHRNQLP
jgi:hypothetical protein